jgi:AbrB family looped-hinge helix DNA binding protein
LAAESEPIEFTVYVRREGRITLPKEIRDALNIEEGCLVRCRLEKMRTSK